MKVHILGLGLLFQITILLCSDHARAQEYASVNGYVEDSRSGETLLTANIAIKEDNRGTTSNTSGYYSLTNLKPGTYTVICTYIGYQQFRKQISVEEGEDLRLDIHLQPEGVELDDIIVESDREREEKRNLGTADVSAHLIQNMPSVLEQDIFRSVQMLPGVSATSDFSTGLYVRGGGPGQTLILLDDAIIYNPSHFFGFYSTFNPDAVKNVRLYKGGYPAEFGGRLGSVLSVYNKDGDRNNTNGTLSLGLLASRASLESPFKNGSWMLSVRRSTLEPVLHGLRETTDSELPEQFYFYDVNGKINFDVTQDDRVSLAFYSGADAVTMPVQTDASVLLDYGNQTISSKWRRIHSEKLYTSLTVTGSRYFNRPEFKTAGTAYERHNDIQDISVKADAEYMPEPRHTLSAGIWAGNLYLRYSDYYDNNESFNNTTHSRYLYGYLQDRWQPSDRWIVNTGIRLNVFSGGDYFRAEPRASVEFRPGSRVRLQLAYGRYYQFLTLITSESFSGFDLWLTTGEDVPPSYGDQYVAGVKTRLFKDFAFDVEFYYRTMNDLFELDPFVTDPAGLDYHELFRFGEGYAYGMEIYLEKQAGIFTGFAGYTFGVTRRKFPGFNNDLLNNPQSGRFYPPKYDRQHDINAMISLEFSRRWTISAIFSYATGQAFTEPKGRTKFSGVPWGGSNYRNTFIIEKINTSRLPDYHRLDLSLSRKGNFFGMGKAEWQLQAINVYSRKNVWYYNYSFDENPAVRNDVHLLPIVPSITYTLHF